jgi:hypothetical protein
VSGVVLSWSGGKDSALALWAMREEQGIEPTALLTTFTEDYGRVSMHAVRRELLEAQAEAVGVPLVEVGIPAVCSNEVYEERMAAALAAPPLADAREFAFADLFLADIRTYREERLAAIGRRASFPGASSMPASRRRSSASTRNSWTHLSADALSMRACSVTSRRASTPAGRTASSIPSSPRAGSFPHRFRSSMARRWNEMASCFTTSFWGVPLE